MAKNKRQQNRKNQYLVERDGKQYGAYMEWETALKVANSLINNYGLVIIRRGDEKVWES